MADISRIVNKFSMLWCITKDKRTIDFHIEFLSDDCRDAMIRDLKSGKTITLPEDSGKKMVKISKNDFDPEDFKFLMTRFEMYLGKKLKAEPKYRYNKGTQEYEEIK